MVNITSNNNVYFKCNETSTWGMWVLKPIWTYVNAKYVSRMPRNRSTILTVKVIHHSCNCKPFIKIGRLSLINIELNLFQGIESAVHWSDGYTMLIGLSLWTCWYFRFWWSLIGMPLGRDSCLPKPSLILRRPRSFAVPFSTLPLPTASQSQSQSPVDMALRMHALGCVACMHAWSVGERN